jgi:transcriptional regulator with XRE-family HTH domain
MPLSNRIKKIREAKNLTQEDVASKCGMSTSAYGQIERNAAKSTFDTLIKIANALDVKITFLVDTENEIIE